MKLLFLLSLFLLTIGCGNYSNIKTPLTQTKENEQNLNIDKSNIDFAYIKKTILQPHCISCHKGTHNIYENYAVVSNSKNLILERIKSLDTSRRMPPQREGLTALNPALIDLFETWVEQGAPEFVENTPVKPIEENIFISFKEIKEKILKPHNCVACHSHFNDYQTVQGTLGSIVSQITSNQMPFPKRKNTVPDPVSSEGKDLLIKWVSQGAPEFSNRPSSTLQPALIKPTWLSLRNNVFGPKCILCHNSFGPRGPKSIASYREIRDWFMKNPDLFNFENPSSSYFMGAILGTNPESFGSTMPFNNEFDDIKKTIPELTTHELDTIKKWIELKLPYGEDDL